MKISISVLLNVILMTVLVTSFFFMNTTANTNKLDYTPPEYDPWIDIDEDGLIDAKDIATTISYYGATGEPTKNVNITDWEPACKAICYIYRENITFSEPYCKFNWSKIISSIFVGGYSRIIFYLTIENACFNVGTVNFRIDDLMWQSNSNGFLSREKYFDNYCRVIISHEQNVRSETDCAIFETKGKYVYPILTVEWGGYVQGESGNATVSIGAYLRNE